MCMHRRTTIRGSPRRSERDQVTCPSLRAVHPCPPPPPCAATRSFGDSYVYVLRRLHRPYWARERVVETHRASARLPSKAHPTPALKHRVGLGIDTRSSIGGTARHRATELWLQEWCCATKLQSIGMACPLAAIGGMVASISGSSGNPTVARLLIPRQRACRYSLGQFGSRCSSSRRAEAEYGCARAAM